jgi:hypothetical protein
MAIERKRHQLREPGYDCGRDGERCQHDKKGKHGIAAERWQYALAAGRYAVSLSVSSGIYPASVTRLPAILRGGPEGEAICTHVACDPTRPDARRCDYVEGGYCTGDCGFLNGRDFFARHGSPTFDQSEAFWAALGAELDEAVRKEPS